MTPSEDERSHDRGLRAARDTGSVASWPGLRGRLARRVIPFAEARAMLGEAGCPSAPVEIGIAPGRLRVAFEPAHDIRRRSTVLDLAARGGGA